MVSSLSKLSLALAALLSAVAAPAQEPGAGSEATYPVAVGLRLAAAARGAHLLHRSGDAFGAPRNPDADVPLADQALVAYALAVHRLFLPVTQTAPAQAELVVLSIDGRLRVDAAGWRAEVEHVVAMTTGGPGGVELGRWTLRGEARVEGTAPGSLTLAFARAAKVAAAWLEATVGDPPGVASWLAERGATARRPPPLAPAAVPEAAVLPVQTGPERRGQLAYLDLAATFDPAGPTLGAVGRLGLSNRWGFVQAGASIQRSDAPVPTSSAQVASWALGLEAGAAVRPWPAFELRAGPGLSWLSGSYGSGTETTRATRLVPVFVAGALYTMSDRDGGRLRAGLQLRKAVAANLLFQPASGAPTEAPIADLGVELVVGYELPWGRPGR